MSNIFDCFFDPVLKAPTIGCMLMCLSSGLIGVLAFVQKRSLLGETLSHSAYPGILVGAAMAGSYLSSSYYLFMTMAGGAVFSLLSLYLIHLLTERMKVASDAALCFVLAAFFGIGVLFASRMQLLFPIAYQHAQIYLYGQVATMREMHLYFYGSLSFGIVVFLALCHRQLETIYFDRDFAKSIGMVVPFFEGAVFFFLILAIVIGMRSVGIVLMSAMLLAPAIAARQFTNNLKSLFVFAGIISLFCAYAGAVSSYWISDKLSLLTNKSMSMPTGPTIVLFASFVAFLSLLFSPKRGMFMRLINQFVYKRRVQEENFLKQLLYQERESDRFFFEKPPFFLIRRLTFQGWIMKRKNKWYLTNDGRRKALHVLRLHRLWETYLEFIGTDKEKIHYYAEKMEHNINKHLEESLDTMLSYPVKDPHEKPIPTKEETWYAGRSDV